MQWGKNETKYLSNLAEFWKHYLLFHYSMFSTVCLCFGHFNLFWQLSNIILQKKIFMSKSLPNFRDSNEAGLSSLFMMASIEKLVILALKLVSQELLFSIISSKLTDIFDMKFTSGIFVINIFINSKGT